MGNFFSDAGKLLKTSILDPRGLTGESQAESALEGAKLSSDAQREQLEYLKEINKLPQQYREQALTELADVYLNSDMTDPEQQQAMVDKAKNSPIYKEIMGGQRAGEEAIARNVSATGGLRSGNVNSAFMDYGTQLKNKALTTAYDQQVSLRNQQLGGIQGIAGTQTNEGQIGNVMAGIGDVLGMGQTAAGNAMAQGQQNSMQAGLAIASMFI